MIKTIKILSYAEMCKVRDRKDLILTSLQEQHDNVWIISITDPKSVPVFNLTANNLISLQFDDIDPTKNLYDGMDVNKEELDQIITNVLYKNAFANDQADKIIDFLIKINQEEQTDDCLLVNCMAGVSRSGAIGSFARQLYALSYDSFKKMNPQICPNSYVEKMLRISYEKKFNETK